MSTVSDKNKLLGVNFRKFTGVIVVNNYTNYTKLYLFFSLVNLHIVSYKNKMAA